MYKERKPTKAEVIEALANNDVSHQEYSLSKQNGVVVVQLHNDRHTGKIVKELTEKDFSFELNQGFEVPPKLIIDKVVD